MNDLLRHLAPISNEAWEQIEEEAKRTLTTTLAARKLVDFVGPLGLHASSVSLGRLQPVAEPIDAGIEAHLRMVQPLLELRVPFELSRRELEAVGRGSKNSEMKPVMEAARRLAMAEDRAVFSGYAPAGIEGIFPLARDQMLPLSTNYEEYPTVVARALGRLRASGIGGPFAIALGPRCYTGLTETTKSGYPVYEHVARLLSGPIVWAPAVDGAVVMSMRGGDFELTVGQDISIGYSDHSSDSVRLYLQESFTFRVLTPEAAVPLTYVS